MDARHGGRGDGMGLPIGRSRVRLTAATRSVPRKRTQPCIDRPGNTIGPKQMTGEPTPGQSPPQGNGAGTR